uniref:TrmO family methyltransferase domain-containing protein n=1 Tax=Desulfococcus sp. TaxID=2025834 RepID=UPI0035934607
ATRSGFRPNPIGLSAVRLDGMSTPASPHGPGRLLHLAGIDLLDGTPVLDIKPYLPYADAVMDARGGFAAERPEAVMTVAFSADALEAVLAREAAVPGLRRFIVGMLQADPRPAYHAGRSEGRRFGTRVFDVDVQWECRGNEILVTGLAG